MKLRSTVGLAASALMRAKMRSLLTTLGVVIGVAAVIIMQAMGVGATALVTGELEGMGSNMLVIRSGSSQSGASHAMPGESFARNRTDA